MRIVLNLSKFFMANMHVKLRSEDTDMPQHFLNISKNITPSLLSLIKHNKVVSVHNDYVSALSMQSQKVFNFCGIYRTVI